MTAAIVSVPTADGTRTVAATQVAVIEGSPGAGCTITLFGGVVLETTDSASVAVAKLRAIGLSLRVYSTTEGGTLALVPQALSGIEANGETGTQLVLFNGLTRRVRENFLDVILGMKR